MLYLLTMDVLETLRRAKSSTTKMRSIVVFVVALVLSMLVLSAHGASKTECSNAMMDWYAMLYFRPRALHLAALDKLLIC